MWTATAINCEDLCPDRSVPAPDVLIPCFCRHRYEKLRHLLGRPQGVLAVRGRDCRRVARSGCAACCVLLSPTHSPDSLSLGCVHATPDSRSSPLAAGSIFREFPSAHASCTRTASPPAPGPPPQAAAASLRCPQQAPAVASPVYRGISAPVQRPPRSAARPLFAPHPTLPPAKPPALTAPCALARAGPPGGLASGLAGWADVRQRHHPLDRHLWQPAHHGDRRGRLHRLAVSG